MRRLLSFVLCLIGVAALTACDDKPDPTNVVVQPAPTATATVEPAPCPPRDRTPPGERPPDCP